MKTVLFFTFEIVAIKEEFRTHVDKNMFSYFHISIMILKSLLFESSQK